MQAGRRVVVLEAKHRIGGRVWTAYPWLEELRTTELYVTDALARALPDVRIEPLRGQAREAMTTAPELYAEAVSRFLLS